MNGLIPQLLTDTFTFRTPPRGRKIRRYDTRDFPGLQSNWLRDYNTKPTEQVLQSARYPCAHRAPNDARQRKKTVCASDVSTQLSLDKPNARLAGTPTAGTSTLPPPESEKPKPT